MEPVMKLILLVLIPLMAFAQTESDPLCGAAIYEDLVLDHDVTCYNSNGLIIGAEGLTINLNGKKITCNNGESTGCTGRGLTGIDASKVQAVSIKGPGTVLGFHLSMRVAGTPQLSRAVSTRRSVSAMRRAPLKTRVD
jgi:hypothetical protein